MSMIKSNSKKMLKGTVCVAAVALSGAVPTPPSFINQSAFAGSATTMKFSGSFVAGVTITKVADIKFAKFAVSTSTGTATVGTNGNGAGSAVFFGTETNGVLNLQAAGSTKAIDVTLSGLGALTITGPAVGAAVLQKIIFGGTTDAIDAPVSIAVGGGTTGKGTFNPGDEVSNSAQSLLLGAVVTFTGRPRGGFTQNVTITMGF